MLYYFSTKKVNGKIAELIMRSYGRWGNDE